MRAPPALLVFTKRWLAGGRAQGLYTPARKKTGWFFVAFELISNTPANFFDPQPSQCRITKGRSSAVRTKKKKRKKKKEQRPELVPSVFSQLDALRQTAPAFGRPNLDAIQGIVFHPVAVFPLLGVPAAPIPSAAGACGQIRIIVPPHFDTPTSRKKFGTRRRKIGPAYDTLAKNAFLDHLFGIRAGPGHPLRPSPGENIAAVARSTNERDSIASAIRPASCCAPRRWQMASLSLGDWPGAFDARLQSDYSCRPGFGGACGFS